MSAAPDLADCELLIVGGGAAGCILARRLAESSGERVVLLEAGDSDEHDPAALQLSRLDEQTARHGWGFRAAPLAGAPHDLDYARARMLGGCANHNDCAFLVPPPGDFDEWAARGARGWSAAVVAPFFRRVEERVAVQRIDAPNPVSRAFVDAGIELGFPERDFRQGVAPGVGFFPLNARGDRRCSSSVAYLHPLAALPANLRVLTGTRALRVLFDGRRATGVQTTRGPLRAHREVLLAAGAVQTPQLLMLSGIGPAGHLREHGLAVLADLPGVGANLLDHVATTVAWSLHEPVPAWRWTPFEATMMLKLADDAPAPDVLYHFGLRVREKYPDAPRFAGIVNGVKGSPNVTRPRSRGRITLASADPLAAPRIELGYFSDAEGHDLRTLLAALRFTRRLAATRALGRLIAREVAPGAEVRSADELADYVRHTCETVYHAAGTAVMGDPAERHVVLDPSLAVKGVEGLRVCDASVFPSMVTVNIANTVMMVAEKAAHHVLARVPGTQYETSAGERDQR